MYQEECIPTKRDDFQFANWSKSPNVYMNTYFFHYSRLDGIKSLPTPYEILKRCLFRREGQQDRHVIIFIASKVIRYMENPIREENHSLTSSSVGPFPAEQ